MEIKWFISIAGYCLRFIVESLWDINGISINSNMAKVWLFSISHCTHSWSIINGFLRRSLVSCSPPLIADQSWESNHQRAPRSALFPLRLPDSIPWNRTKRFCLWFSNRNRILLFQLSGLNECVNHKTHLTGADGGHGRDDSTQSITYPAASFQSSVDIRTNFPYCYRNGWILRTEKSFVSQLECQSVNQQCPFVDRNWIPFVKI